MYRSVLALLFAAVLLLGGCDRLEADCAEGKERTGNKHGRSGF